MSRERVNELKDKIESIEDNPDYYNNDNQSHSILVNRMKLYNDQMKEIPKLHLKRIPIILFQIFLTFMIQGTAPTSIIPFV